MPAEAGIQSVGDINNFKDLDSRFCWNDGSLFQLRRGLSRGRNKKGNFTPERPRTSLVKTFFPIMPLNDDWGKSAGRVVFRRKKRGTCPLQGFATGKGALRKPWRDRTGTGKNPPFDPWVKQFNKGVY
jgi:hypothetical protein